MKKQRNAPKYIKRLRKKKNTKVKESSVVFACTHEGRTRDILTADIGSDVNLMDRNFSNVLSRK